MPTNIPLRDAESGIQFGFPFTINRKASEKLDTDIHYTESTGSFGYWYCAIVH